MIGHCSVCFNDKSLCPANISRRTGERLYRTWCNDCEKERKDKWRLANRERHNQKSKKWAVENKKQRSEISKKYRKANAEKCLLMSKQWRRNNPDKSKAYVNSRRKRQKIATPHWACLNKITQMYMFAQHISKKTGIPHHVDHIIPLINDYVCGLHVIENLSVVEANLNLRKSNKFVV